jgi:hypothetical protein
MINNYNTSESVWRAAKGKVLILDGLVNWTEPSGKLNKSVALFSNAEDAKKMFDSLGWIAQPVDSTAPMFTTMTKA